VGVRAALVLLIVALAYASIDHGGFFRTGFRIVVLLVLVAASLSVIGRPASVRDLSAPLLAAASLALWYLVAAVIAGDVAAGAPAVELLVALAAVLVIVRRAGERERRLLLGAVLAVGTITAVTGWVGVVWRTTPLALPDACCGGVWRAASTITYANAAAAVLSACLLVTLALLATTARPRPLLLVAFVLLVGLLATLSRGGFIGLLGGVAVLAALDGRRAFVRGWPALVGALVAASALLPSLRLSESPHIALACTGLVTGAVVAVTSPRAIAVLMTAFALTVAVAPGFRQPLVDGWRTVEHGRFTATSPDRTQAVRVALRLARDHPVAGVGPGLVDLTWRTTELGVPVETHVRYAHNEYVQVLAEAGGIGFVILIGGLVVTGVVLWRRRRNADAVAAAGCIAALAAIGVSSSSDYLWHVPVIPLIGAVLVAVVLPGAATDHGRGDEPADVSTDSSRPTSS
jgi:O-Antigen ligase